MHPSQPLYKEISQKTSRHIYLRMLRRTDLHVGVTAHCREDLCGIVHTEQRCARHHGRVVVIEEERGRRRPTSLANLLVEMQCLPARNANRKGKLLGTPRYCSLGARELRAFFVALKISTLKRALIGLLQMPGERNQGTDVRKFLGIFLCVLRYAV